LLLATEGDTKDGAGQSVKRDLIGKLRTTLDTTTYSSVEGTQLGPLSPFFSSTATRRASCHL
jgi:hypothetical protein